MQPTVQQAMSFSSGGDSPASPPAPPAEPPPRLRIERVVPPFTELPAEPSAEQPAGPGSPPLSPAQRTPFILPLAAQFQELLDDPPAGAWTRWFARSFDVWLHSGLVALVIGYGLSQNSPTFLRWIETPFGWKLFGLVCVPLGFMLDAWVHSVAGNTPGKALLGLRVVTIDGRRPRAGEVLERNMGVWSAGLGFGLPGIGLLTMARQGLRLRKDLPASYDVKEFIVRASQVGRAKKLVFGLLFSTLFALIAALDVADRQEGSEIASALAGSSYSWTNPETGYPANIASQWRYETLLDEDGAALHRFTQHSGHAVVIFASAALGDTPLRQYTRALADKPAGEVYLSSGYFEDFRGTQSWVGMGEERGGTRVQLRVVQVHGQAWRVMVKQSPPYGYTDELVRDLARELWVTVTPR